MTRSTVIQIRVSAEEKRSIEERAKDRDLGVSDYLRSVALVDHELLSDVRETIASIPMQPKRSAPRPAAATAPAPLAPRWRCKHRSCPRTSDRPDQCPVHLGTMVAVDRPDQLVS